MPERIRVSIVGGSGYVGGELIRLLKQHPHIDIAQITSESQAGNFLHSVHPKLRPLGDAQPLRFTSMSELVPTDALFLALPHGQVQHQI